MTFHVGQKVVCVDDTKRVSFRRRGWFERFRKFTVLGHNLNSGDIYTVIDVGTVLCNTSKEIVQTLHVTGAWHFGARNIGFPSFQFRPVAERKTDISIFTRMLLPQGVDA